MSATVRVFRDTLSFNPDGLRFTCTCGWKEYGREGKGAFHTCVEHIQTKHHNAGATLTHSSANKSKTRQWHVTSESTVEIVKEDHMQRRT